MGRECLVRRATDGQARCEAHLAETRGKAVQFRARQYSPAMKAGTR